MRGSRQLAATAGWHLNKISKIESGKQTPSEDDIKAWARTCGPQASLAAELIASLRTLEGQYVAFRRMFRSGQSAKHEAIAEIESETSCLRSAGGAPLGSDEQHGPASAG